MSTGHGIGGPGPSAETFIKSQIREPRRRSPPRTRPALKRNVSGCSSILKSGDALGRAALHMTILSQRHRARVRTEQSAPRIFALVSCFLIMVAGAGFISRDFFQRQASTPADQYLGVVQLAPDQHGNCERFELNNKSAVLRATGSAPCQDITAAVPRRPKSELSLNPPASVSSATPAEPPLLGGTVGRMNGIRDHFKAR